MQLPLQISFRNVDPSDAVRRDIEQHMEKLEQHYDRITHCRVVVEAESKRGGKGKLFNVRIDLTLPGHEIAVNRKGPKSGAYSNMQAAVRAAFAAAQRSLKGEVRKLSGEVKRHDVALHGEVIDILPDEGYGFVRTPAGERVLFRKDNLKAGAFSKLELGDEVRVSRPKKRGALPSQAKRAAPVKRPKKGGSKKK